MINNRTGKRFNIYEQKENEYRKMSIEELKEETHCHSQDLRELAEKVLIERTQ